MPTKSDIPLHYLACPYNDPDPAIKEYRTTTANQVALSLFEKDILVFSPLTHNNPLNTLSTTNLGKQFMQLDLTILSKCEKLLVLKLPGWQQSNGVAQEIALAQKLNIPIDYIEAPTPSPLSN